MAPLGLPGISVFLQSILRDLDAAIKLGVYFFMDFDRELNALKELLFRIEDVLVDGERKRFNEYRVNYWMDDLKDLLYDTNYLVEEIKMEKQQLRQAITFQPSNNSSSQVCVDFSSVYNTSNIIKRELSKVSNRFDELDQEAVRLNLKRDAFLHDVTWFASEAMVRPKMGCYADISDIYGREKDIDNIVQMLLVEDGGRNRRNYEVVSIVGMGGPGKTTLAQLVFQDGRVKNHFEVNSWACVSDVFNAIKVTQDLIESAEEGDGPSNMPSSIPALQARLKKIINKKRFLLMLDDVWTVNVWGEELKAPMKFGAKGSKILVTTRLKEVVETVSSLTPYQLRPSEDADCLAILNNNAFGEMDEIDSNVDLKEVGQEIARKCGGVPLVAKVIGAMLNGQDEVKWKAVKENLLWNFAYECEDLHPGLRLSYFYLPPFLKC